MTLVSLIVEQHPVVLFISSLICIYIGHTMLFGKNHFNPTSKHCYIIGGSSGLGKALAEELVRRGADVTIVARRQKPLDETMDILKSIAKPGQKIAAISADLTDATSSQNALNQAIIPFDGKAPDYFFLCAGHSIPRLFVDTTPEQLKAGLDGTFWVQAYTAHAAFKLLASQRAKGSIVFVSSFLGYTSFAGYSSYSPGKFALRGLADTLRSEAIAFPGINIHIFMPAGIDSPGYVNEQLYKHAITKKIEDGDKVISAEECAGHLIRGLEKGYYQPTSYFITDLVRVQTRGACPGNNPILDSLMWLISGPGLPIWRMFADSIVRGFRKDLANELEAKGFYTTPK
ncbi:hypothetical protein BCR39DRAFT_524443 [Naematelia encephala]|uniref:3-dehydrosphinganine reductase n=1 Tax=Naematelia encephala TaxID=71784 RepID=A0A1Y2BBF6_9TREE|nr:hypothetical protein BCR39DRAFT_524443 [Naematelia encephala]